MNGNFKKFAFLSLTLGLAACSSSSLKHPETIEAKMARFEANTGEYLGAPQIPVVDHKFTQRRGPASESAHKAPLAISNKRLYFMGLYTQYNEMRSLIKDTAPEISVCPSFHSAIVDYKEKNPMPIHSKDMTWDVSKIDFSAKEESLAMYPELFLPASKEKSEPRVIDLIKKDGPKSAEMFLTKALQIHVLKSYHELNEICENGVSDNYYVFENLVTHTREKGFAAKTENMKILMKSGLFSNMALIDSLKRFVKKEGRSIASTEDANVTSYNQEVMNRLKAPWAKDYFEEVRKMRKP